MVKPMSATIPSMWPDDIKADVLPPIAILRSQAEKIRDLTQSILFAEVTTTTGHDDFSVHRLELVAPRLGDRRYGVLSVTHRTDFYPLVMEADCFRPRTLDVQKVRKQALESLASSWMGVDVRTHIPTRSWPPPDDWRPVVADQEEFFLRIGEVLRSMEVRSVISSMIASSNEKNSNGVAEPTAS